jgi:hypothetical protein
MKGRRAGRGRRWRDGAGTIPGGGIVAGQKLGAEQVPVLRIKD